MANLVRAKISALGTYVPPRLLTNDDLEKMVETSSEWIVERTGIKQRHIVDKGVATSHLAVEAGRKALEERGISGADVEAIFIGTVTPDMLFPSTACLVQDRLGAKGAWGYDISAAVLAALLFSGVGQDAARTISKIAAARKSSCRPTGEARDRSSRAAARWAPRRSSSSRISARVASSTASWYSRSGSSPDAAPRTTAIRPCQNPRACYIKISSALGRPVCSSRQRSSVGRAEDS